LLEQENKKQESEIGEIEKEKSILNEMLRLNQEKTQKKTKEVENACEKNQTIMASKVHNWMINSPEEDQTLI
jgi:predicted nuclease with TOPRIM domain